MSTLPSSSASGLARPPAGPPAPELGRLQEVSVPGTPVARLEPVIGTVRYARLLLLDNPGDAQRMGKAGQEHIRESFVGDRHLLQWAQLISVIMGD